MSGNINGASVVTKTDNHPPENYHLKLPANYLKLPASNQDHPPKPSAITLNHLQPLEITGKQMETTRIELQLVQN